MNAESAVRSAKGSYPRALEARGVSFDVARSPVLLSSSHARTTQKAPGGSRGTWFTRTCGVVPQFAWRAFARWFQPGLPGLALTQKAPGGSRGTPGGIPSRLLCDEGSHKWIGGCPAAWTVGWFSSPESPGFRPGLLGPARSRRPRRVHAQLAPLGSPGWRAIAGEGNLGFPSACGSPPGPWMADAVAPAHPFGPASACVRLAWMASHRRRGKPWLSLRLRKPAGAMDGPAGATL